MTIGNICTHDVLTADKAATAQYAAQLMRQRHVGDVVVIDSATGKPCGIITDRDIVVSVIALNLDPDAFTLGDLVCRPLVSAHKNQDAFETVQQMRAHRVRRMPIVDDQGSLVGIVTADDLIRSLAQELGELANVIISQHVEEMAARP